MGLRIGWISEAIFSVRSFSSQGKDWIEAWVADNFFNVSSKFNLHILRKRRKWKMLSDTKRMLLFSPFPSLGLISNAYCYTLFHRSYISELRVELYSVRIGISFTDDGFWQRMVQTGKQLTISGWKITNTSLAFTCITYSFPLPQWMRFLGLFARLLFLKSPSPVIFVRTLLEETFYSWMLDQGFSLGCYFEAS